jgi:hypothetical protein
VSDTASVVNVIDGPPAHLARTAERPGPLQCPKSPGCLRRAAAAQSGAETSAFLARPPPSATSCWQCRSELHPQSERLPVPIAAPSHKAQPARLRAGSRAAAHWDTGRRMAALFLLTTEIPRGAARPGRGAIQRGC